MHCLIGSVSIFWCHPLAHSVIIFFSFHLTICHQALAHSVIIFFSFHLTIMSDSIFLSAQWAKNKGATPLYNIIRWSISNATNSIFLRYVKVAQQEKLKASLALFAIVEKYF